MRRLLLFVSFCCAASFCAAQTECPTNYDSDSDDIIGVSDLLFFLGLFGESDLDNDGIWSPLDDCDGIIDACGVCGGDGIDTDGDGVCDSADPCIGIFDECGVCAGDGPNITVVDTIVYTYDSLFISNLNEWYVFVVESDTTFTYTCPEIGCTSPSALNYNASAVFDDGTCLFVNPYIISEIEFNPTYDWSDGTLAITTGDDVSSSALPIGFDFNFFGTVYDEFRVNSNGWLSFDLNETAGFNPNGFIPNANLPANSIMAVYSDLNPTACGNIRFGLDGESPNRKCFVNWNAVCQFSCTSQTVNAQIVLHEATNSIEIYIGQRASCSWGSVCTGIQNGAETVGAYPVDLPTGNWEIVNRAWRYVPAFAQPQSTQECGYNPDSDADSYLTVADLLGLLGQFGNFSGVCEDMDADGICDDEDDCIGIIDECGVCNGPGPDFLIIDEIIYATDSVFLDALDEWYVYEFATDTLFTYVCPVSGCTDETAENYIPEAVIEDGSCVYGPLECGGVSTVTYDGYTYDLVAIGDQCWFAENVRTEHYANGDVIPGELSDGEWSSTTSGAVTVYGEGTSIVYDGSDDEVTNLADYGRLYNWYAVDDARGLCPSGWHVPTDGEFMTLEMELGMSESQANGTGPRGTDQGAQMKSSASDSPAWNGTNTSGFSGLAGGSRSIYGDFYYEGDFDCFWSASASGTNAWGRFLYRQNNVVERYDDPQRFGFSVRCVRD